VRARLLWLLAPRLARERGRAALTVIGIALGVSVFVAIRLASGSALASFGDTVDAVSGRANLEVSAVADGFDERLYARIRREPGVRAAAPIVEVRALARKASAAPGAAHAVAPGERAGFDETVLVLGVDAFAEPPFARFPERRDGLGADLAMRLLAEPGSALVTDALARRHGLRAGDTLYVLASGRPAPLVVATVLGRGELDQAMGGELVLADLATVQETFARQGRLDRVDLIVDPRARERVRASLNAWLPVAARAQLPRARTQQVENLVRAFALNLLALSFIAVFVSAFLVFNAVALAVVRQRREIGVWRALGVTRAQVAGVFLAEGALLGLAGGVLGAGLGALLANAALAQVGRSLTALYLVAQAGRLWLDPGTLLAGIGIGVASALVSALAPALEAAGTPPGATIREGSLVEARRSDFGRLAVAGLLVLVLAAIVTVWTHVARAPLGGFASAFLVLVGFSLFAPLWTRAAARLADPLARRLGIAATLGVRAVRDAAARGGAVVAAIMIAVGMLVALTTMIASFRGTVDRWITQTLRGDLYVEPVGHRASGSATALPAGFVDSLRTLPGVSAVDTYRGAALTLDGQPAQVVGIEFAVQREHGRLQFVNGEDARRVLQRALDRGGVIVTESFAHRRRVRAGERIVLPATAGPVALTVEGVFYDYSTDAGAVLMDRALYSKLWNDDRTESLALYLVPGASRDTVREALLRRAGPERWLHVMPNQALRARVLEVFDETFRITWVLQAIAIIVSVLGVASTLTTLVLQRGRELATLRAVGARRAQVRTLVLAESALLGVAGALLGCVAGLVLAMLLVHVINRQFFGWSIQLVLDPGVFVGATLLLTLTATLAGLLPARLATSARVAGALRVE
jgi:putative ABC transport system permease protein